MSEDVYLRLRSFMQKMPTSFPDTSTGVELKILSKLFTEEQAELTMHLTLEPESVASVAARTGLPEAELAEKYEEMAVKGLIFRVWSGETRLYRAYQFLIGLYEFQLPYMDAELGAMMDEFFGFVGMNMVREHTKTHQMRILPVNSAVNTKRQVAPYNRIKELVKDQEYIVVNDCICRVSEGFKDHHCEKPFEVCFSFGDYARYSLDNGSGRRITPEEAVEILELADKAGLILSPSNTKELAFICCCCTCCCGLYRPLNYLPTPGDYVQSYYYAEIDSDLCTACGTCQDRCEVNAIKEKDGVLAVDLKRCLGCGLCVSTCPEEAIAFIAKEDVEEPCENIDENLARIAQERGIKW